MRFFLMFLSIAVASPAMAQSETELEAGFRVIDGQFEKLLEPAPKPTVGWKQGGLDLRDILRSRDGVAQLLYAPDEGTMSVTTYGIPTSDLLPPGWYPLMSRSVGERPQENLETTVIAISPTMVMVASGPSRFIDGADCRSEQGGLEVVAYRHPQATSKPSDREMGMLLFFDRYFTRIASADICFVTRPTKDARFAMLYFASDGREIPALHRGAKPMSLHPVSNLASLLKLKP